MNVHGLRILSSFFPLALLFLMTHEGIHTYLPNSAVFTQKKIPLHPSGFYWLLDYLGVLESFFFAIFCHQQERLAFASLFRWAKEMLKKRNTKHHTV
ncbi:uncharacterized protein GGS25DRAFT_484323 [Hypoxylon fragiforme]|uniref:uncharacterized protein n=1 Tax=Hypoxylon fragiforme TaxID=63214 RepID=UPI0020C72C00|nr:uncharacterized protein GGS25DRAFT_484323 [Hypoxylon fragiforme]KAI2609348.1 hypothetical protein GGS25DRAFT_484323 [Hypoxylon fragiforme]